MHTKVKIFFIFFIIIFILPNTFNALGSESISSVSLLTENNIQTKGKEFTIDVIIRAQEPINAFSVGLSYPQEILTLLYFDNSNSIVDVWQKEPKVVSSGHIVLSGGLLHPFQGTRGKLITLHFKSRSEGDGAILLDQHNTAYRADGTGTEIVLGGEKINIKVKKEINDITEKKKIDRTPPVLSVEQVINPIDGTSLIVFTSHDDESGTETFMRGKSWFAWGPWEKVESPIPTPKDMWMIELTAKNYNGIGVEYVIVTKEIMVKKIILVFLAIILIGMLMVYNKKNKRI